MKIFAFIALISLGFVPAAFAQKRKTAPKPEEVWYLTFDVTIKGSGVKRSGNKNELVEEWTVDRSYSGVIELNLSVPTSIDVNKSMSAREMIERVNAAPVLWLHTGKDVAHSLMPVKVKIHDATHSYLNDKGEGGSFEKTHNAVLWDGEGTALADASVQLFMDRKGSLYNVTIPLHLHMEDRLLKKSTTHVVNRSNFGYGDAPTVEDTSPLPEEMALGTLGFPKVIALFTGGTIHHPHNMPLELNDGGYQWDSGDLDIDEPIFKSIPASRQGIKIHIYYRFKKMTAN